MAGAQRSTGHLRCGCAAPSPGTNWAAQDLQGGARPRFGGLLSLLTPRGWRVYRDLLEREQAGVCGGCLSCGSPPRRVTSGDTSGRSPRPGRRRSGAEDGPPGANKRRKGEPAGGRERESLTKRRSVTVSEGT